MRLSVSLYRCGQLSVLISDIELMQLFFVLNPFCRQHLLEYQHSSHVGISPGSEFDVEK